VKEAIIMTESARTVVQKFVDAMGRGDIDVAASLVAEDLVNHAALPHAQGRAGFRTIGQKLKKAFPDMRGHVDDVIVEGDKVVVRMTVTATHTGPLEFVNMPLPPTGKNFKATHIHICRVAGGSIVEHWAERDDLGMMRQLGVIPRPS
jgi:predicted ester cyclase